MGSELKWKVDHGTTPLTTLSVGLLARALQDPPGRGQQREPGFGGPKAVQV